MPGVEIDKCRSTGDQSRKAPRLTARSCVPLVIALAGASGCFHLQEDPGSGYLGKVSPPIRYTALDGSYHGMEESRGKPLVLAFWTTWCQFSRPVIKSLNELAASIESKSPGAVTFVAINVEENGAFERLRTRIEVDKLTSLRHAFSGNGLLDEAYLALNVANFPQIVVLDGEGTVITEGHNIRTATRGLKRLGITGY